VRVPYFISELPEFLEKNVPSLLGVQRYDFWADFLSGLPNIFLFLLDIVNQNLFERQMAQLV
jgi:hypothetical protein